MQYKLIDASKDESRSSGLSSLEPSIYFCCIVHMKRTSFSRHKKEHKYRHIFVANCICCSGSINLSPKISKRISVDKIDMAAHSDCTQPTLPDRVTAMALTLLHTLSHCLSVSLVPIDLFTFQNPNRTSASTSIKPRTPNICIVV